MWFEHHSAGDTNAKSSLGDKPCHIKVDLASDSAIIKRVGIESSIELGSTFMFDSNKKTLEAVCVIFRSIAKGFQKTGESLTCSAVNQIAPIDLCVGARLTVLVETIIAGYDIYKAYNMWKDGVIDSRARFIKEVNDIVLLALFRSGGNIAGMVVGQLVIPIPVLGGLVGAVLGVFVGHLIATFLSAKFSETFDRFAQLIDQAIDATGAAFKRLIRYVKSFIYGLL